MLLNKKSQLIELQNPGVAGTGNTATRFTFNDQPYLRFKSILSLETYSADMIPTSPLSGFALPTNAQLQNAFLTLYINDPDGIDGQGEWIQNLPLLDMVLLNGQASASASWSNAFNKYWTDHLVVFWDKSYITLSTAYNNTTNLAWLFTVGFETTAASRALNN